MKIEAKNDGKLYTVIRLLKDEQGTYLLIDTDRLDSLAPYVVIDGMVYHGRLHARCPNCQEKYWMPLNQTLEEFKQGWRVTDIRRFRS